MSHTAYDNNKQLRAWNEQEIDLRESLIRQFSIQLIKEFTKMNNAWSFHRVEGTILTPNSYVSPAYTDDDIWATTANIGGETAVLRAETTRSSYEYARKIKQEGVAKLPMCIWQSGKSFRREKIDGANWNKLRAFEFYQLEFQCLYSQGTKADYNSLARAVICRVLEQYNRYLDFEPSDRLPDYSTSTTDAMMLYGGKPMEVCSISQRKDFGDDIENTEIAIGLCRLVEIILYGKDR